MIRYSIRTSLYADSADVTPADRQTATELANRLAQLSIDRKVPFRATSENGLIIIEAHFGVEDEMAELPTRGDFTQAFKLSDQYDKFTVAIDEAKMAKRYIDCKLDFGCGFRGPEPLLIKYGQQFEAARFKALNRYSPERAKTEAKSRLLPILTEVDGGNLSCWLR